MVRLQRVTVLALHNYLGLTNELFSHVGLSDTHTHTHRIHRALPYKDLWMFSYSSGIKHR